MDIGDILGLLGGVALFLFGMSLMGDNLKKVAGAKLELVLYKLSSTPIRGILLGTGVTAVIQSSSATSVMVVGFVNSKMMKFKQAIGVVMGSIIGTSITGWILCLSEVGGTNGMVSLLSTSSIASMTALIGIAMYMFSKKQSLKNFGGILLGFSVLMFGMKTMSGSVSGLKENPEFINLLTGFDSPVLCILIGIVFTAILQSASASVGILQALSVTGVISFSMAFPLIIGMAIGASIPVLLSAIGSITEGKQTAFSYLLVNVIGAVIAGGLFYIINGFAHFGFTSTIQNTVTIALMNTVYRFVIVLIQSPFVNLLNKLSKLLIKDDPKEARDTEDMERLEDRFLAHPALAVEQSRLTVNSMAEKVHTNLKDAVILLTGYSDEGYKAVEDLENIIDKYEDKLGNYLVKITSKELSPEQNSAVGEYLHTISDLERISDHALNIAESAKEIYDKKLVFSNTAQREIHVLLDAVENIVEVSALALSTGDLEDAYRVEPLEECIDNLCSQIKANHIDRLVSGNCTLENGFVLNDLLTNLERIGDHCSNIGLAVIEAKNGEIEGHAYLDELERMHTAAFDKYYGEYSSKYSLNDR